MDKQDLANHQQAGQQAHTNPFGNVRPCTRQGQLRHAAAHTQPRQASPAPYVSPKQLASADLRQVQQQRKAVPPLGTAWTHRASFWRQRARLSARLCARRVWLKMPDKAMQARMTQTPSQRALECLRQSSECHEALKAQCCFSASHLLGVPEVSAASQARLPTAMLCIAGAVLWESLDAVLLSR